MTEIEDCCLVSCVCRYNKDWMAEWWDAEFPDVKPGWCDHLASKEGTCWSGALQTRPFKTAWSFLYRYSALNLKFPMLCNYALGIWVSGIWFLGCWFLFVFLFPHIFQHICESRMQSWSTIAYIALILLVLAVRESLARLLGSILAHIHRKLRIFLVFFPLFFYQRWFLCEMSWKILVGRQLMKFNFITFYDL